MTPENRAAIIAHAREEHPREACGLLVEVGGVEVYRRCRNLGAGMDQFIMDPVDYAEAELSGEVVAIVHSHPGESAEPSPADLSACQASGLVWHIVAVQSGQWQTVTP